MAAKRLTRIDFAQLAPGRGKRVHGRYFTLSISKPASDNGSTEPKFACVVSKKTARRAVDRNLIKRRARDAVRILLTGSSASVSLVFYAKKEAVTAPYRELVADIQALVSQA